MGTEPVRRPRQPSRAEPRWIAFDTSTAGPGPPPKSGVVRVRFYKGQWQLTPKNNGQATQIRFRTRINFGGWLPKWMTRTFAGKDIPELFTVIAQMIAEKKSTPRILSAR